jgi:membrane-associated phospholipid phosphatase
MFKLKPKQSICMHIFLVSLILILCGKAYSSPLDSIVKTKIYHVNYPVVGVIIAAGITSDIFAIKRIKAKTDISDDELIFLNTQAQRDIINPVDRWALGLDASKRATYQKIADYGMVTIILLPGLLLFDKKIRKDWGNLLLMYVEGQTITFTFYNYSFLGPTFQNRYRPMTYYPEFTDDERQNGNNRNSFYSGHVATCTYSTFFMAKVYCDYHPELQGKKYLLYAAAAIPPILMGFARTKSLDHFPSDDAVGFALGAVIGIVVPQLHKYPCSKVVSLGMFTSPLGTGLSLQYKLPLQQPLSINK